MSEHFNEQISEFIDDEMSAEEGEFFVRRLARDESARRRYLRYQLIGAAVRGEYRYAGAADLGLRLEHALEADEAAAGKLRGRWVDFAGGAGIAACVALVAVFGLRALNLDSDTLLGDSGAMAAGNGREPPSYVVPQSMAETQPFARVQSQLTGIQYLIHHARYTSGVNRTIMRSSVIAGREANPTEAIEADSGD